MLNTSVRNVDAGASGAHPGDRPRQAWHCLHPHRAKARPVISAEDGTMQRAHHGDVPAAWLAEKIRAAAVQSHLSMDIFVILAMNERPFGGPALSVGRLSARRNPD
jgi:hypothetical protein